MHLFWGLTRVRFAILLLFVPMTEPLGRRMVHFEFGQDWSAKPYPLQAFELGYRSVERAIEAGLVAEQTI